MLKHVHTRETVRSLQEVPEGLDAVQLGRRWSPPGPGRCIVGSYDLDSDGIKVDDIPIRIRLVPDFWPMNGAVLSLTFGLHLHGLARSWF